LPARQPGVQAASVVPGPPAKASEDANAYAGIKRKLAGTGGDNREGYTHGKSGFVPEILRLAGDVP